MALAAFSKHQLLNVLRSTALLCPIAYMGQIASPLAKIAADNFLAEVMVNLPYLHYPIDWNSLKIYLFLITGNTPAGDQ